MGCDAGEVRGGGYGVGPGLARTGRIEEQETASLHRLFMMTRQEWEENGDLRMVYALMEMEASCRLAGQLGDGKTETHCNDTVS
jgi:hypothetical protein